MKPSDPGGKARACQVLCVASLVLVLASNARVAAAEGHLVLVGGGPTPAEIFSRTLALSGGRSAVVAVVPQTFPTDSIADLAVTMWTTFKAREVVKVSRTDIEAARAVLERATLIWMPGGFPSLLIHTIADSEIPTIIRARFAAGVTIGGASAGAMAMSTTMIADESTPDGRAVNGPVTEAGLGLWPEAIVSAHFTERRRLGPLADIVREHPTLFGVGIDEGTAVFVSRGEFEVLGRGTVAIVDSRRQGVRTLRSGTRLRYGDTNSSRQ